MGGAEAKSVVPPTPSIPWVIESAAYAGRITEQIARLQAVLEIRVMREGWVEIPLPLSGATITSVEVMRKPAEAHLVPRGGAYVLTTSRKGSYTVKIEFSTRLVSDSQYEGVTFGIPQAGFSTLSLRVPRKDVELRTSEQLYVERRPDGKSGGVLLTAHLASSDRVDVRWATRPATPIKVEPMLYGEVSTLVVLEEQLAHVTSVIDYRITQGELRELMIELPQTLQVLNVRGAGIDGWRVEDVPERHQLFVKLNFALKETNYRLVIEGEHALQAEPPTYQLPELRLVGVKQDRGQLAIATSGSLEVTAGSLDGLTRIDSKETSDLLKAATTFPILMAFRYHQHPFRASLNVTRYQDLPVLNAIAEQGELVTILSRQGEVLMRAVYAIRANKKQFLGVLLPSQATLWSCLVDGRSVKPVNGEKGQLLVPLATANTADQPIVVELVYFEQRPVLSRLGRLKLNGPVLDIPTTIANWLVYTPRQVRFLRTAGNLEQGASLFAFVDEPFTQLAYAAASPQLGEGLAPFKAYKASEDDKTAPASASLNAPVGQAASDHDELKRSRIAKFASRLGGLAESRESFGGGRSGREDKDNMELAVQALATRMQEAGIFPLRIRLPKAGTVHRFNRLMTTQEALELNATFVNLPTMVLPFAGLMLLVVPIGGLAIIRFRRA